MLHIGFCHCLQFLLLINIFKKRLEVQYIASDTTIVNILTYVKKKTFAPFFCSNNPRTKTKAITVKNNKI